MAAPALLLAAQPAAVRAQMTALQSESEASNLELQLETAQEAEDTQLSLAKKNTKLDVTVAVDERAPGKSATQPSTAIDSTTLSIHAESNPELQAGSDRAQPDLSLIAQTQQFVVPPSSPQQIPTLPNQGSVGTGRIPAPQQVIPSSTDVLVPNPQITIDGNPVAQNQSSGAIVPSPQFTLDGNPAPPALPLQPTTAAPPFLPRAVAPPVGDMAVSNINAAPEFIDLGTAARVESLVLKDAPAREVLSFLARSAGLNLVFTGSGEGEGAGEDGVQALQTVSLDLENEPIQEAFNYVLQITGLEANRRGRTIIVGANLPQSARNLISRSFRLNQVDVNIAASFLTTQGAVTQLPFEQIEIQTVGEGAAARTIETRTPSILALTPTEEGDSPLLLSGLAVSTDDRLNTITVVGPPRKVEMATAFLMQLDARRRQVAVNVKIVDISLLNQDNFNSSFSFGINDTFFVNDDGAASLSFGQFRPATNLEATTSLTTRPVITNPFDTGSTFLDLGSTTAIPDTLPGTVIINEATGQVTRVAPRGAGNFLNRVSQVSGDPFATGFTDVTLATDDVITISADGTASVAQGNVGTAEGALAGLFQFPRRFLSSLRSQIISGNAKILTDPTLVVQEGQVATVNLTQQVFSGFQLQTTGTPPAPVIQTQEPILTDAGLILGVQVERIDDNGFVTLAVNPTVSSPAGSVPTDQGPITLIQERSLSSGSIRLRDGQTLIIAGIIQDSDRTTVSKIPILGDIPLLGALFRSTQRDSLRNEVVVLLTPQILDDSDRFGGWGYNYNPGGATREALQNYGTALPAGR